MYFPHFHGPNGPIDSIRGEALEVLKDYMDGMISNIEIASKMENIKLQNKNTKVLTL
jgi:hypothetical protein